MFQSRARLILSKSLWRSSGATVLGMLCLVWTSLAFGQDIPDEFEPVAPKPKAVYFPPENFDSNDDFLAFREHAYEFLQDHPDHKLAPRALHDLILIHNLAPTPDAKVINGLKTRLVFEFPESITARILMKSFKDQSEYRNLLTAEFRKPEQDFSRSFCRQLLKAAELGVNMFGPDFLNDDNLQILVGLCLSEGKSFRLTQLTDSHYERLSQPVKSGMDLCRPSDLTPIDRATGLHRLLQSLPPTQQQPQCLKDAERFWMTRLTPADRQQPDLMAILIEQKLSEDQFEQALIELNQLLVLKQEPKWLFWHGWCLANVRQFDASIEAFEKLKNQFPADPWSRTASELIPLVREIDLAITEQVEVVQEVITDLKSEHFEQLQVHAIYQPQGKSFELAASADSVQESIDAFVLHGGQPLVGYQATMKNYKLFVKDQSEVIQINKPGSFPDLVLGMQLNPNGFAYNFNLNMHSTPEAARSWRKSVLDLLNHPLLANKEAVQVVLRWSASKNGIPVRVRDVGDRRSLVWLTPEINRPQLQRFEFEWAPPAQHEFTIRSADFSIEAKYGKSGTLKPQVTPWEHLPVIQKQTLDVSLLMQAMSTAALIFNPEPVTQQPLTPQPSTP